MTLGDRAERVLKDLDRLSRDVNKASFGSSSLCDKVELHRTNKDLQDARCIIRKRLFDIEGAEKPLALVENCPACYNYKMKGE